MTRCSVHSFWRDESGAVAAIYAIALTGLIAIAGVGFDYARMAGLDSELQNGADQAALAGATQLDGEAGACARAGNAAVGLLDNITLLANDGAAAGNDVRVNSGTTIGIADDQCAGFTGVTFYADKEKTTVATTDAAAKFIEVAVEARTARYVLTPIAGALSPTMFARAMAGVGAAICNTPPVMMCNPTEPEGNTDPDYPFNASEGDGVRLVISSPQAPGDFGFLQTGYGTGAQDLARALGYNSVPADCAPTDGVTTEPGDKESVRAAFNTRFDVSEAGLTCPNGGTCSPSRNARKDLVRGNICGTSGNQGWQEAANPYRPTSPTVPLAADGSQDPDIMGYPRDMCHGVGFTCGIVGDGLWDRDAYFRVNYLWDSSTWTTMTGLSGNATRYEVYKWELENPTTADMAQAESGGKTGYSYPVCRSPGITPTDDIPDRRRISVAVINCRAEAVAGRKSGVHVLEWMDVFLVEPAFARGSGPSAYTTNGDIYVEVIAKSEIGGGGTGVQTVHKSKPYLIE